IVYDYRARPGGSSMTDALGSAAATVAYLEQERACAADLRGERGTRLGAEYWRSILGGDVWVAAGRLASGRMLEPGNQSAQADEAVAGAIRGLLELASPDDWRGVGEYQRLGLPLAAAGRFDDVAALWGLAGRTEGFFRSAAEPASREALRADAADALAIAARHLESGLHRSSVARLVHRHVLAPLVATPVAWDDAQRGRVVEGLSDLANHPDLDLAAACGIGSAEAGLLAALLATPAPDAPGTAVFGTHASGPGASRTAASGSSPSSPATVAVRVESAGTDSLVVAAVGASVAPGRVFARCEGPGSSEHVGREVRLTGERSARGDEWTMRLDLSPLPRGTDWSMHAVPAPISAAPVSAAPISAAPITLEWPAGARSWAGVRPVDGAAGTTFRRFAHGAGRLGPAIRWRLQRARRRIERALGASRSDGRGRAGRRDGGGGAE
ncbi:MAG: hypothetical protein ACTH31_16575, partial [Pseudoclavibacter sp.]